MHYKILTENGVDFTNIDEARNYWFNSGGRDGIVKGAFNEGALLLLQNERPNGVMFDTCELRIGGHRIIVDEAWSQTYVSIPSENTRYALIAEVVVDDNSNVAFRIFEQLASVKPIKNELYKNANGAGTYQVEIGRFTLTTSGLVEDVVRTLDLITGGSSGMGEHFVAGNITTTMLDAGMDANVTAEDIYDANGDYKQTDFSFELPETAGTVVKVNNVEQANLDFTSDPQTQLNNKVDKETGKGLSTNDYTTAEKTKLGGIEAEANKTIVDSALSTTSENPVQNKIVKNALDTKQGLLVSGSINAGTVTSNINDTIIEYYVSSNRKEWYRIWKSGFKECGGIFNMDNVTGQDKTYQTITLPLKINYILSSYAETEISSNTIGDSASFANIGYWEQQQTTTTARVYVYKVTSGTGNMNISYYVIGY